MVLSAPYFFKDLFSPLSMAIENRRDMIALIKDLGYDVQLNEDQQTIIRNLIGISEDLTIIIASVENIISAAADRNDEDVVRGEDIEVVILSAHSIFDSINALKTVNTSQISQLPDPLNSQQTWEDIALLIPEYLMVKWLYLHLPILYEIFNFIGIIEETELSERLPVQRKMHFDKLIAFLSDPDGVLVDKYQWGGDLQHQDLIDNIERLSFAIGFFPQHQKLRSNLSEIYYGTTDAEDASELAVTMYDGWLKEGLSYFKSDLVLAPVPMIPNAEISGLALTVAAENDVEAKAELVDDLYLSLKSTQNLDGTVALMLSPDGVRIDTNTPNFETEVKLYSQPENPLVLIGKKDGTRLELAGFECSVKFMTSGDEPEICLSGKTRHEEGEAIRIIIKPGDGDNFISKIMGDNALTVSGDAGFNWSSLNGFTFTGGAGFEVIIPINADLGVINIKKIRLGLSADSEGMKLEAAVSGALDLQVLQFIVEDVGVRAKLYPAEDGKGLIGPFDMKLGFKPPNGFGLLIKAGVVKGGGYLEFNEERQEYAGVGEITINDVVSLTAIGILTTKMPDGSKGWSLFLSVFSTFPPLGPVIGFYLKGVGGLVGINRTLDAEALRGRMIAGAMDSILFPENPVENAPRILNDIRAVFPPCAGQYMVGLMAKFVWGETAASEAIGEIDLGIMIELPDPLRIILMGQLAVKVPPELKIIPGEQAAGAVLPQGEGSFTVVELHADILGILDLTAGTMAIDALLRDSGIKIIQIKKNDSGDLEEDTSQPKFLFALYGDMAFRADLNGKVNFLYSVGGFHPKFKPPAGFPDLRRITAEIKISKGGEDIAGVSLKLYHAITSQTFQMGGRLDVWAKFSGFSAEGYIEMDALIQIKPFGFDFHTGFGVMVKAGSVTLMGVEVSADMTGPSPFEIVGHAQFEILKVKKKIKLEITIGDEAKKPPEVFNVGELVYLALADRKSWGTPEEKTTSHTILRERPDVQEQPISPFSTIEVVQRIVPLNVEIEEFGHGIIEGDKKFEIEKIFIGDGEYIPEGESVLKEWFAPGNYFTMGDNEKIKAPSFEKMDAGLRLSREGVDFGNGIDLDQQYEEISLDMSLNHRRKYSSIKSQLKPDTLHKFTIAEGDGIIRGVNPYEMNDRNFTDLDVSVGEASVAGGPQVATFAEAQLMVKRKNQISFDEFKRFEVVSH